jgi:glycosyltransferase involved in cell wall biosynthesis
VSTSSQPRDLSKADGARREPHVCMVAYSDYVFDARIRREAETLASNGFRVTCFKLRNGAARKRCVLNNVDVRELSVPKYQGKSRAAYLRSYLRFLIEASAACCALLLRGELDAVHVHNLPDFLVFAGLVPRLAGRKVVLDIHDSIPETFATKFSGSSALWNLLCLEERLSALLAHRVICVNDPQRDTLVGRGISASKTFVSMNVPDPAIFKSDVAADRSVAAADGHFNVVYHGTMAERLGVDLIIRAIASLRERIPGLRLHLWGRGDDLPRFQHLATELRAADVVEFKPQGYPLHELPARLRPMQLGVIGNRRSPACDLMLPVKLMEYVSLGIPAVAPRLRTIEHYFSDQMITFYEPENVRSLADSIYRLYAQPESRRRQAASADGFLTTHGWERQGGELVDFYRQLLEVRT